MNIEEARKETITRQEFHPWMWILVLLLGFSTFFYLGWVYQTSWYWYYGIDPVQLNFPLATIFQQGLVLFLFSLGFILIIFMVIFVLRLIVLALRIFFFQERRSELASLFSIRNFFQRNIHFAVMVYVALIYFFLKEVEIHNSNTPKLETPANIVMLEVFIIPVVVILFIRLLGDFLYMLPEGFKSRLRLTTESGINDMPYRVVLGILLVLAVSIKFTGVMAVGDASVGFRQNASYQAVRRVYLKSYVPIAGLESYRQDCDCGPYVYGPLGYLGNNAQYLLLVPWKADGEEYFPQFPPLYQIEQSSTNTINIIPDAGSPPEKSPPSTGMSDKLFIG